MITFLRAHKRLTVIIFSWVVFCCFFIIPNWHEGPEVIFPGLLHRLRALISAQLFWIGGILALGKRFVSGKPQRVWFAITVMGVYALFIDHDYYFELPRAEGAGHSINYSVFYFTPSPVRVVPRANRTFS